MRKLEISEHMSLDDVSGKRLFAEGTPRAHSRSSARMLFRLATCSCAHRVAGPLKEA